MFYKDTLSKFSLLVHTSKSMCGGQISTRTQLKLLDRDLILVSYADTDGGKGTRIRVATRPYNESEELNLTKDQKTQLRNLIKLLNSRFK